MLKKNCLRTLPSTIRYASSVVLSPLAVLTCRNLIFFIVILFYKTRTVTVVSEETKKQLDQMIAQNKELEEILAKSRSDYNAKVFHESSLFRICLFLHFPRYYYVFCFPRYPLYRPMSNL